MSQVSEVLQYFRGSAPVRAGAGLTDGQLLDDYLRHRDSAALSALVWRHGPMVWGVCRRLLGDVHDAEDAFQATFLVLVRRAASIQPREQVANWLYGVARQTARKARDAAARRRLRERAVASLPEPAVTDPAPWHLLRPVLDQELGRLPDRYRTAIVLCDLEERSRGEAARHLGVPEGTLASWLARGRRLLAKRLTRRGITGPVELGCAERVPLPVLTATIQAVRALTVGGALPPTVSAGAAALAEGVVRAMIGTKVAALSVVGLALVLGTGLALASFPEDRSATDLGSGPTPAAETAPIGRAETPARLAVVEDDLRRLVGTWRLRMGVTWVGKRPPEGRELTPAEVRDFRLTIAPGRTLTFTKGEIGGHRTFLIAPGPQYFPRSIWLNPVGRDEDKWLFGQATLCEDGSLSLTCYHALRPRRTQADPVGLLLEERTQWILERTSPHATPDLPQQKRSDSDRVWNELGLRAEQVGTAAPAGYPQFRGGLRITELRPNGPAAAQLQVGDLLVGLNAWETVRLRDVLYVLDRAQEKSPPAVPAIVLREGFVVRCELKLSPQRAILAAPPGAAADILVINTRTFQLPVRVEQSRRAGIRELQLFTSSDEGQTWRQAASLAPDGQWFDFVAPRDGLYWFQVRIASRDGTTEPRDLALVAPAVKVRVVAGKSGD